MRREMGIIGCVFLFSIATIKPLFSQELYNEKQKGGLFSRPSQFDHRLNGAYFQWYLHDTKELIIAPGRWKKKDWLILGGSTATAALLVFTVDKPAQEFFEEHQDSDFIKGMNKILNPFKALTVPVYFGAIPIVYGLIARSNRAKKVGLEVLEAQLVTSVVHYPINWVASRTRPKDGGAYNDFNWIWNKKPSEWTDVETSFPSGHAVLVYSSAAVIAAEYYEKKWVPPAIYAAASVIGVQRIAQNAHWISDVFYGAIIGHFMTQTLVKEHRKSNESLNTGKPVRSSLRIFPLQYAGAKGVRMVYRF
ncbi:MAG: phosphatase PAP2 family protein [Cytophagales bacterium]|nr:phosphatase PAP2 family protein [Cytophagales bacterium]